MKVTSMSRLTALLLAIVIFVFGLWLGFAADKLGRVPAPSTPIIETVVQEIEVIKEVEVVKEIPVIQEVEVEVVREVEVEVEVIKEIPVIQEVEVIREVEVVQQVDNPALSSEGFVDGFNAALAIVTEAKEVSLSGADAMLNDALNNHGDAFSDAGQTDRTVADRVLEAARPSSVAQEQLDQMTLNVLNAQEIAMAAVAARDYSRRQLEVAQETITTLEALLTATPASARVSEERNQLIAALALEQQRVVVLREALADADARAAELAEQSLLALDQSDDAVAALTENIDRLTQRYNQTIDRLELARADLKNVGEDMSVTLDTMAARNASLQSLEADVEAAQAQLVDVESQRLATISELATLTASVAARQAELNTLNGVEESVVAEAGEGPSITVMIDDTSADHTASAQANNSRQLNDQMIALASKIAELEETLTPLQTNFDAQVQQQAALRAAALAEPLAQEMAMEMAADRARGLADEMAGELAEQLAEERASILASILADERVGQMTAEEIAAVAGMRIVSEDTALDTIAPLRAYLYDKLLAASASEGEAGRRLIGERLLLSTNTLFPSAGIQLSNAGQEELRAFGEDLIDILAEADAQSDGPRFMVQVNGHADKRPYRTNRFGNWELSSLRAVSVVEYLIEEVGLPANRLIAAGFAEHQPLIDGDTESEYALNRRIEFRLVAQ